MRGIALVMISLMALSCSGKVEDIESLSRKAMEGDDRSARRLVLAMGAENRERSLGAYRAVLSLGKIAEPYLYGGLKSNDRRVFESSAAALGNIGSQDSVPLLIDALGGEGPRRYAVAWALGEIGSADAVLTLVEAIQSEDDVLRKTAVRALVKIGPGVEDDVMPVLRNGVDSKAQRAAIRILGEIKGLGAVSVLEAIDTDNRDAAVWALGRIGDPGSLRTLIDALNDERPVVRRQAAEALGNLEVIDAVPALRLALEDPEPVVREWAARSLETLSGVQTLYRDEDGHMVPPYNLYR